MKYCISQTDIKRAARIFAASVATGKLSYRYSHTGILRDPVSGNIYYALELSVHNAVAVPVYKLLITRASDRASVPDAYQLAPRMSFSSSDGGKVHVYWSIKTVSWSSTSSSANRLKRITDTEVVAWELKLED